MRSAGLTQELSEINTWTQCFTSSVDRRRNKIQSHILEWAKACMPKSKHLLEICLNV